MWHAESLFRSKVRKASKAYSAAPCEAQIVGIVGGAGCDQGHGRTFVWGMASTRPGGVGSWREGIADRANVGGDLERSFETVIGAKVRPPRIRALQRERLFQVLGRIWNHRLALVVGPAGSGKTTLLAQFAAAAEVPVAWFRADGSDVDPRSLVTHLEAAFAGALPGMATGWTDIDDGLIALEQHRNPRLLLVIDDLHALEGGRVEPVVRRLVDYAPASLRIILATRVLPRLDLSRARIAGEVLEIGPDDLRFRSWEVEKLFHDFYREPLPPEDLASLARRTEGWAAGLQLFHLATAGKTPQERQRMVLALGSKSKLLREYLARNVIDELPRHLRTFLLDTCVLGRLSGELCNALRCNSDGADCLAELERRQIFTTALDGEGTYRYHEVLRSFLEATLLDDIGEGELHDRYRQAARLLEESGNVWDALEAYCRAGDFDAAARLLGRAGERFADPDSILEALPSSIVRRDPFLVLASARASRAAGRGRQAIGLYREAEELFESEAWVEICRRERAALAAWVEPYARPSGDWSGALRSAVAQNPGSLHRELSSSTDSHDLLASGFGALLAGHVGDAERIFSTVAQNGRISPALGCASRLGLNVAGLLAGRAGSDERAMALVDEAETLGIPWMARVARAAVALSGLPETISDAITVRIAFTQEGDFWGSAIAALFEAWGRVSASQPVEPAIEAALSSASSVRSPVLEAWARAIQGIVDEGDDAPRVVEQAYQAARSAEVPGAEALALSALERVDPDDARGKLARSLIDRCGIAWPVKKNVSSSSNVSVRCFGGFELRIDDRVVDLATVRPRARAALRLLALHAGNPVHKEVIMEALWPDQDVVRGTRNLHVALSSLRAALNAESTSLLSLVRRAADAYIFEVPRDAIVDHVEFARLIENARVARSEGDDIGAISATKRALDLYSGDLFPEDGPSDWVVESRAHLRSSAVDAARDLAVLLINTGDPLGAVVACDRGLQLDRFSDAIWRLKIEACRLNGDVAAGRRAESSYESVLAELGVLAPGAGA